MFLYPVLASVIETMGQCISFAIKSTKYNPVSGIITSTSKLISKKKMQLVMRNIIYLNISCVERVMKSLKQNMKVPNYA